jgi:hypothetical protein
MKWVSKYRLNPIWYFETNTEGLEKIFEFIKNHDFLGKEDIRDNRISYLLDEDIPDPLEYLDDIIDKLYSKFQVGRIITMNQPVIQIYYIENQNDLTNSSVQTHGLVKSKSMSAMTSIIPNNKFDEWIQSNIEDYDIFLYQISLDNFDISIRYCLVDRKMQRINVN